MTQVAAISARIGRTLLVFAAAISALAFANWGTRMGIAASVGAAIGVANWFALRWLGGRIMSGETNRALISFLTIGKIGFLIAIVALLINTLKLDPVGLCMGLSVLFLGPAIGAVLATTDSKNPAAAQVAHEER
jgi:hypothetical protein